MKRKPDVVLKVILLAIAVFLGAIALRAVFEPAINAHAQAARFDHVTIVSPVFLYKGQQGMLLLDKRNGNFWFMPRSDDTLQKGQAYRDPVFVMRLQFEKLDEAPQ